MNISAPASSVNQAGQQSAPMAGRMRTAIIVGAALPDTLRSEVKQEIRPRIDVLELEKALSARVYDFGLISAPNQRGVAPSLCHHMAKWTNRWSVALAYRVLPAISSEDVVYATGEDVGQPLAVLLRARRLTRPQLVMRLEHPTYGRTRIRRAGFNLYFEYAAQRIDRILCRTDAHLQYLNSVLKIPLKKLCVIPEETDTAFYDGHHRPVPGISGIDLTQPYIMSAGLEMRDYGTLIAAVRGLDIQVVIAAGSPWSHFRFEQNARSSLPANVHVSSFSPSDLRALYAGAAFVVVPVHPTLRACGMNVVLEAWAMKRAVIATRTVGLREYVADGETGILVSPNHPGELRGRIQELLACPSRAEEYGQHGYDLVQTQLNIEQYVKAVTAVLHRPVQHRLGRSRPPTRRCEGAYS
jgi:glycosyltransferase involved in cell wall biosynthesis